MVKIIIKAENKTFEFSADKGTLISELLQSAEFFMEHPCAGRGTCGKCRVRAKGKLSKPTKAELKLLSQKNLKAGFRLSCQAKILGDAEIAIVSRTVFTDKIFEGAYPLRELKGPFGIAIDLGTTTVAAFLVTLKDGLIHKGNAVLNQQSALGAEVISRMESSHQSKSKELKKLAEASIQEAVSGLGLEESQYQDVKRAIVVGNSAMHHLFLGFPVESLMKLPFQPVEREARKVYIRILSQEIETWVPPLIGGFVGSDALACLIYLGFATRRKRIAAIDLGTNGEVMVTDGNKIVVASTAAGPAFEGVNIECGMRASKGAICSVSIAEKSQTGVSAPLELEVIGGGKPKGIAGSGLLSLVNFFRKEGKIDSTGRLESGRIFLTETVYLSQSDVREVQKAKSAVRAAFEVLLERLNLKDEDLEEMILTGSFGARVNVRDALELGLIPEIPQERIKVIANAAGMGAGMMLARDAFEFACELAEKVEHIELFTSQEFMDRFINNMRL